MASGEINVTVTYKTVFLVESHDHGLIMIDGVFSSEGFAQAYIEKRKKVDKRYKWREPKIIDYTVNKGFVPARLIKTADAIDAAAEVTEDFNKVLEELNIAADAAKEI